MTEGLSGNAFPRSIPSRETTALARRPSETISDGSVFFSPQAAWSFATVRAARGAVAEVVTTPRIVPPSETGTASYPAAPVRQEKDDPDRVPKAHGATSCQNRPGTPPSRRRVS